MACYSPLKMYPSLIPGERFTFKSKNAQLNKETIPVPCGQCTGCRLLRANNWATRCVHEASLHEHNCFITLTYNDEHLPENGSLNKEHLQLFLKRLRKSIEPEKLRFYACGEYGEKLGRPHYHLLIFGHDFKDKYPCHKLIKSGHQYYRSQELEKRWDKGYSNISDVSVASAAYVARYIMKKITGELAADHYTKVNPETGELYKLTPEFNTMSRRPGLAHKWFSKYKNDLFPRGGKIIDGNRISDGVTIEGKRRPTPDYYIKQLEKIDPITHEETMEYRKYIGQLYAELHPNEKTDERLKTKEIVANSRLNQLKRPLQ